MFNDLTGQKFGRLTVIERVENAKDGQACWLCQCECGNTKIVRAGDLRRRNTKSCGCIKREQSIQQLTIHGLAHTRIYKIWSDMKARCSNPKDTHFREYGERGITVCNEWKNDFMSFYNWSMKNGYTDKLTLDRIDNNKSYSPNNCKYATRREQANNRRSNHFLTFNNETHSLSDWSRIMGIKYSTLLNRIRRNWSVERALTTFVKNNLI